MDRQYDVIWESNETPAQLWLLLPLTLWSGLWLSTPLLYDQCESRSGHFLIKIVINKSCDAPPDALRSACELWSVREGCDHPRHDYWQFNPPSLPPSMNATSITHYFHTALQYCAGWETWTAWWFSSQSLLITRFCVLREIGFYFSFMFSSTWRELILHKNGFIKKTVMYLLS